MQASSKNIDRITPAGQCFCGRLRCTLNDAKTGATKSNEPRAPLWKKAQQVLVMDWLFPKAEAANAYPQTDLALSLKVPPALAV
jgi:hypothetical protein